MSVFEADIEIHVYVCHVGRMLDPRLDRHIYVELTSLVMRPLMVLPQRQIKQSLLTVNILWRGMLRGLLYDILA